PLAMIVGLGNPGSEYASHRHNVGFQIVDSIAESHGLSFTRHKKARARVAEGRIGERRVVLAKPQTFMNLSGRAVLRLSRERE
ncbi:MAG: aminoacyl-tRNA hydrolase, partial [Anaerolineae bacterium]|nr:aminoacyl-tRNA hydrolase [Anaerolineae bacterium]